MRRIAKLVVLFSALGTGTSRAGQINISAFTPAATIQTFESLGNSTANHTAPFLIGSDWYDTDNHVLRSSGKFGPSIGRSGVGISSDAEGSSAPVGFVDVSLGSPALRAGMYVGFEVPWAADVSFYDTGSNLIGTATFSGNKGQSSFAGWQADSVLIGRIRVVDQTQNNLYSILIDDFIQEVPEPASLSNVLVVVLTLLGLRVGGEESRCARVS